jgi:diguanylate cyclase (GGDEF)-like protein/PAS domain S-box-containing protein
MHNGQQRTVGRPTLTASRARALLLEPRSRDVFDRLARLVGQTLRAPVAMLGVVEGNRLVLVSQSAVPEPWASARYLPLEATFCWHTAVLREAFVVNDAAHHPIGFSVTRLENFPRMAYCGAPIIVEDEPVAVLSVTDARPRHWSPGDVAALNELADSVLRELERLAERPSAQRPPPAVPAVPAVAAPDALIAVDAKWRVRFANGRALELLGINEQDVGSRTFWEIFPGLVGTVFQHECLRVIEHRRPCEVEDYCASRRKWLELRAYPAEDGGATLHLRDITARRTAQEQLRGREVRYRRLFEESRTPLIVLDDEGILVEANRAFEELLTRHRQELYGTPFSSLATDPEAFARVFGELREQGSVTDAEVALRRGTGDEVVCIVNGGAQVVDGGVVYHAVLHDITQQKRQQDELVRTAFQDPLTELPNRSVFMDRLGRVLKHSRRHAGYRFAVLFLDLDNFKHINDSHGHLMGDRLLQAVARRLEACVRQEDTVARLGGDEFAVLLDTIQDTSSVMLVVDRIRDSLAEPFSAENQVAGITASIGIAMSVSGYDYPEDLVRDADAAMYRAKMSGRDGYVLFDTDMHARALAQRQLEEDLRGAIQQQQLTLQYHPVVELEKGSVAGLEALIRWRHPDRGVLQPSEFMPIAERTGLIIEFGWWVLREACRQLRTWQLQYPEGAFQLTMSVNLSTRQFVHPALVEKIDEILEETGLPPQCLRLDVTESVIMQNTGLASRLLGELRKRGIQICIDDFGTGYSSMRKLRELPISILKIDSSFIRQLGTDDASQEVVETIIALGRSMAIDAIAEGVETPEQLERLRRLGARFAQGFLFSLPLDSGDAGALLEETNR